MNAKRRSRGIAPLLRCFLFQVMRRARRQQAPAPGRGKCCEYFLVRVQNQIEAQQSGFDLERRSSGMSAL